MSRNKCIDTLKGIACILVLFIHYPLPGIVGEWVRAIARGAVPFFFLVSGYFYGKHRNNNSIKFGFNAILNNVILLVYGFAFSELFVVIQNGSIAKSLQEQITWVNFARLLLFNDTGQVYHLWFLFALIYCYCIWIFIDLQHIKLKQSTAKVLIKISLALCYLVILFCKITNIDKVFLYRNWIFIGMPFFSFGVLFDETVYNKRKNILYILLGVVLTFFEFSLKKNQELYFGSILLAIEAFIYCKNHPQKKLCILFTIGRKYSAWFYILHWGIMHVEYYLITILNLKSVWGGKYLWLSPIVLSLYTLVASVVVEYIDVRIIKRGFFYLCKIKKSISNG